MNDTVIFRGKASSDGKWVEGYLCKHAELKHYLIADISSSQWRAVYDMSIGQWTGEFDKNGVKIYEKDIILVPAGFGGDYSYPAYKGVVTKGFPSWHVDSMDGGFYGQEIDWENVEVVGNIYDDSIF